MKRCGRFLAESCVLLAVALMPLQLAADAVGVCTPVLSWQFDGAADDDALGESVSNAGDVNNDGFDDLIIGALRADPGGLSSAGSAYVYRTDAPTCYADADGDGYGNVSVTLVQCNQPIGYVTDSTDCDDTDPDVHPGAAEVCNGLDDNCDGSIDEGGICCSCPFQADFNADNFLDAVDLNALIDALFFNGPDPQDPNCPTSRGDFNNDGVPDDTDLNALIDALFFNGPDPCDPCDPVQASCGL